VRGHFDDGINWKEIPMSTTTVTQHDYEIREGLSTSLDGSDHPFIEGLVLGEAVVNAIEIHSDEAGSRWILATYTEFAELAGTGRPNGAELRDEADARLWVTMLTAVYAKGAAAQEAAQW
jgi:hypothetical protein